jgi:hypothetical protein
MNEERKDRHEVREAAQRLAEAHYRVEPGISGIYPVEGGDATDRTIRLLEVNAETFASGIVPVGFGPHPPSGIPFPSVIVEVTPREFDDLKSGRLTLPDGWTLGSEPFARPTPPQGCES